MSTTKLKYLQLKYILAVQALFEDISDLFLHVKCDFLGVETKIVHKIFLFGDIFKEEKYLRSLFSYNFAISVEIRTKLLGYVVYNQLKMSTVTNLIFREIYTCR
jgi:hypothetical protein